MYVYCKAGIFCCLERKSKSSLWQGYASTEESLGNSVLMISDMSDVARDASFPAEVKLKAALRLLFTKQPAWVFVCYGDPWSWLYLLFIFTWVMTMAFHNSFINHELWKIV